MIAVSVVICAYTEDRWDDLVQAVDSIRAQIYQPKECLLIIDHNDALFERASSSFPDCTVIKNAYTQGLSGARNTGLKFASGDVIAFMDEDATAAQDWLSFLVEQYEEENVMGAGGWIEPNWISAKPAWFPAEYNWVVGCSYQGLPQKTAPVRNLIGCNMSFRKEVFDEVGGFENGLGRIGKVPLGCEETELCIRARQRWPNRKVIFAPSAKVLHNVPDARTKFKYFVSRCYSEGLSKAAVSKLVGSKDGLDSEWQYVLNDLPKGVFDGIKDSVSERNLSGVQRSTVIIAGLAATTYGYLIAHARDLLARSG